MKSLDPNIYDEDYYLNVCLGSEEFKKSNGTSLHSRVSYLLSNLKLKKNMSVLDVGCGRGDVVLSIASKVKKSTGVDYSKAAIKLAKKARKRFPKSIQEKTEFHQMNIKALKFPDNSFDLIICIDVFEHLYREELDLAMSEIKRVLKPNGVLFVHTGTNKVLNEYIYPFYTYPMNLLLTTLDKTVRRISYEPLPKNPRTKEEEEQHVNEPTYYYLRSLFKRYGFDGHIEGEIGYIKNVKGPISALYNFCISLYPVSKIFPLNVLFSWVFICTMRNLKS